jgi:AcrR family transcriptional regulator
VPGTLRARYFDAAIEILAERGQRELTMAELCATVGKTTGSFYRHFGDWADFKNEFLAEWLRRRTLEPFEIAAQAADPHDRIELIIEFGCALPHLAEAALRAWAVSDPQVREMQQTIDTARLTAVREALLGVSDRPESASRYSHLALDILIGFQMSDGVNLDQLHWELQLVYAHASSATDQRNRRVESSTRSGSSSRA